MQNYPQKKVALSISIGAVVVAVLAVFVTVGACAWSYRDTPESRQANQAAVTDELGKLPPEDVIPFLRKLSTETFFKTAFETNDFFVGFRPRVPYDLTAQLTVDKVSTLVGKPELIPDLITFVNELAAGGKLAQEVRENLIGRTRAGIGRVARRKIAGELKAQSPETVLKYLSDLLAQTTSSTPSPTQLGTNVPYDFISPDYIGQLTEEQFIRFAGDGGAKPADVARLKELLTFSDILLKMNVMTVPAANALKERRLDGYFLSNDFDGAITYLETEGIPSRTPAWCKGTAAKLRAHKAMEQGDKKEAVKQLLVFGDFMLSDEQKDFEDCDPTTGIVYSREWVVARNYMRCSKMSRDIGDTTNADKYLVEAKKYFTTAHEKAKDDDKSLKELRKEMKEDGFALPALPAKTKEPPAAK